MILLLNSSSWLSANLISTGMTYVFFLTSSLSPSRGMSRVASFSVVMMILPWSIWANVSLMVCTSLVVNKWWSPNVRGLMWLHRGFRSSIICLGDAMPVRSRILFSSFSVSSGNSAPPNNGRRLP